MSAIKYRKPLAPGAKFGFLTVVRPSEQRHCGKVVYECLCDCGKRTVANSSQLKGGWKKSCGCRPGIMKHGHVRGHKPSLTHRSWRAMLSRCLQASARDYSRYGGKGIKVCERWQGKEGFVNFLADMGERPCKEMTIDRHPNQQGDYEPGNCRWATKREQAENRRDNTLLTFGGETMPLSAWARRQEIQSGTLIARLREGWTLEDALTKSVQKRRKKPCQTGEP